jgi:Transposase DDE domain/Insertion element 4 transposase N-terminal
MSQSTRQRFRDQINLFRESPEKVPFADLLDPALVQEAVQEEGLRFRERIFTPWVILWTFLSPVLSTDHSCRKAVSRLVAYLAARGRRICDPDIGGYCKARGRLPLGLIRRLVDKVAAALRDRAPSAWRGKGREVVIVDGTTVSMPDTAENQRVFPQQRGQAPGLGFPIARVVGLISLTTGALLDLAIGPYKGKQTGETALFRTLLDRLRPGEIVLGDRTFASFFGIWQLVERSVDGLFRLHQSRRCDFRRGRRLGIEDHVVRWTKPARPEGMDRETYARIPDEMWWREIRVRVHQPGFRVEELVLVTTLRDAVLYTKDELADLYLKRWNREVCQADCVSRYTLYRPRGAAHSGRRGAVGTGTMEPAAPRNQPRRTAMRRHIERPCPPPARTIRLALSA